MPKHPPVPQLPPQLFTTHDIATMLQVDASTVSKWIDRGILIAWRTPGGHRRVREEDLRAFLKAHSMPVPTSLGGTGEVPPQKRSAR